MNDAQIRAYAWHERRQRQAADPLAIRSIDYRAGINDEPPDAAPDAIPARWVKVYIRTDEFDPDDV